MSPLHTAPLQSHFIPPAPGARPCPKQGHLGQNALFDPATGLANKKYFGYDALMVITTTQSTNETTTKGVVNQKVMTSITNTLFRL